MIQPTRRTVWLLAAGVPVALLPAFVDARLWTAWLAVVGGALIAIGLDALLTLPASRLEVETRAPKQIYAGDEGALVLSLGAPSWERPTRLQALVDLDPALLEPQPTVERIVPAGGRAEASLKLVPRRRGLAAVRTLWLRVYGPLGLVVRIVSRPLDHEVEVVPDVGAVRAAALRLFGTKEHATGIKVERYLGDGSEFDSLREFVPGFDARSIDWKATARHVKLMVREFRAERNHQVVLAFDTGRLMGEPLDGLPKLDHAINGGLVLAYVCLRTGDRVGLFAFDAEPRAFVAPVGGVRAFDRVRSGTADLEYATAETNYTLGIADLSTRLKRRSLVVVFTDFVDTVTAELMVENMDRLARRHLVLFVALADPSLQAVARGEPATLDLLHRAVVAADLERERALVLKRLIRSGVHCIDAAPRAISTPLLNRYLEIRRRELV